VALAGHPVNHPKRLRSPGEEDGALLGSGPRHDERDGEQCLLAQWDLLVDPGFDGGVLLAGEVVLEQGQQLRVLHVEVLVDVGRQLVQEGDEPRGRAAPADPGDLPPDVEHHDVEVVVVTIDGGEGDRSARDA